MDEGKKQQQKEPQVAHIKENNAKALKQTTKIARKKLSASKERELDVLERESKKTMREETRCPVCMEIITKATILNPCGHIFCAYCIAWFKKQECAICRSKITNITRTKTVDALVWGMILRGDFQYEEALQYVKRSDKKVTIQQVSNNTNHFTCIITTKISIKFL